MSLVLKQLRIRPISLTRGVSTVVRSFTSFNSYLNQTPIKSSLQFNSIKSIHLQSIRFQSNNASSSHRLSKESIPKVYTYTDIKNLITNPDPNKILVDVREPHEFQAYAIPTSINIPYKSTPGALDLSPEEFEEIFKFPKPSKDKELIFYCVAGVRSSAAADLANIFGYEHLGNYKGSIQDWFTHENPETAKEEIDAAELRSQ